VTRYSRFSYLLFALLVLGLGADTIHAQPPRKAPTPKTREITGVDFVGTPYIGSREIAGVDFVGTPYIRSREIAGIDFVGTPFIRSREIVGVDFIGLPK
jgi:hypothetical protein